MAYNALDNLKEGTWDEKCEEFGDTVIDTLAEHAPNIKDIILHRQIVTPLDLEGDFGWSEGNIFQGELTLEPAFLSAAGARSGASIQSGVKAAALQITFPLGSSSRRCDRSRP